MIDSILRRGYKEAGFAQKKNAQIFSRKWKQRGYNTALIRSSGPVVEGGFSKNAYYVVAQKPKSRRTANTTNRRCRTAFETFLYG